MIKVYPGYYVSLSALTVVLLALPAAPNPDVGKGPIIFLVVIINIGVFIGTIAAWHSQTVQK